MDVRLRVHVTSKLKWNKKIDAVNRGRMMPDVEWPNNLSMLIDSEMSSQSNVALLNRVIVITGFNRYKVGHVAVFTALNAQVASDTFQFFNFLCQWYAPEP